MTADKIFKSTKIYTVTRGMLNGGVAVSDNIILAADTMEHLQKYIAPDTKIIDFGSKLLMPGFVDGHTHMMAYAPKVDLSNAESIEECVEMIRKFYEKHKDADCIRAEKWYAANWDGTMPTCHDIDNVIPDIPFFAVDLDIHKVWVNSCLLKQMGINKDITITQDPQNVSGKACITQSQDIGYGVSLSNVYLANFKIISNSAQRFAIYFRSSYGEIIDCKNCVIENVECNSVRGCAFYANNITLKNLIIRNSELSGLGKNTKLNNSLFFSKI